MKFLQKTDEIIDISNWYNLKIYEEGSKRKREVFSPQKVDNKFLNSNYRYLIKYSTDIHNKIHKEQFWIEIFAYYLGELVNVWVPRTFVAIDNKKEVGALSEWFYLDSYFLEESFKISNKNKLSFKNINYVDNYISGYNFMAAKIEGYDQDKGGQHNLKTIFESMQKENVKDWLNHWIRNFVFDTLLGDTDRHQDNWGILYHINGNRYLSPAFDNGTSMGYEILENNFDKFNYDQYIKRGYHHIKLSLDSAKQIKHLDLISELIKLYDKKAKDIIENMLKFKKEDIENILNYLVKFNTIVPLTEKRAEFMLNLLWKRKQFIMQELNKK
jgi:hypothetical protein